MKNLSSNTNEVTRAVLNPLLFFYEKILHSPKHQKHKKALNASTAQKKKTQSTKSTEAQKRNRAKAQNAISE